MAIVSEAVVIIWRVPSGVVWRGFFNRKPFSIYASNIALGKLDTQMTAQAHVSIAACPVATSTAASDFAAAGQGRDELSDCRGIDRHF